jgi:hypothetical protein
MKPVVKLWYSETGELRLLKEWPDLNGLHYYHSQAQLNRIKFKFESLPVVNAEEVMAGYVFKEELKRDSYHDMPGATWEKRYQRDFSNTKESVRFEEVTKEQYEFNKTNGLTAYAQHIAAFIHLNE